MKALVGLVGEYPPGSLLRLDDTRVALVTRRRLNQAPEAVLVVTSDGTVLDVPEPVELSAHTIVEEILPDIAGVDPASLIEQVASL